MINVTIFICKRIFIVPNISSVTLDENNTQVPIHVTQITRTIIETEEGNTYIFNGGYLDIGIINTMKDLLVNFVGAFMFSVIGYYYEAHHKTKSLVKDPMIEPLEEEIIKMYEEDMEEKLIDKMR